MIPKNIFQSWYTHELPLLIQSRINIMRETNPDYTYKLYTDSDMDEFVNTEYKGEIADCYNKLNIIVAKVDFWRYLILYKYGGVYLDMDSHISVPLNELIRPDDQAIITAETNPNLFAQWALFFNKKHPILKQLIELVVYNINTNKYPDNVSKTTGPYAFSTAIKIYHYSLYNVILNHESITANTDLTYETNNISYRIYSIDYNKKLIFKFPDWRLLYINKKHWKQEIKTIKLLKS
jgi:inositol phosphorylceramide mannosyltransferase catalytic subunit